MSAAPFRKSPLICNRLVPAVNVVEHGCHGNACESDVTESPRLDVNVHGDSAAISAPPDKGVSAIADSVPPIAEEAKVQTVSGGGASAQRESRCVAAAKRNAARV